MDPAIVIAVVGVSMTWIGGMSAFAALMWRIGGWQAKQEERGERFIVEQKRMNSDARENRENLVSHLEGHIDA
jgi:hypothetical protein